MSNERVKEALAILQKYAEKQYHELQNEGWRPSGEAFFNVETHHSSLALQKPLHNSNGQGVFMRFIFDASGQIYYCTPSFKLGLLETCDCGNARGQPFVAQVGKTWAAISHLGTVMTNKFWRTRGEAEQSMKKLLPLASKYSEDEVQERKRVWLRDRLSEAERVRKKMHEQAMAAEMEQRRKEQELERMMAGGFGSW